MVKGVAEKARSTISAVPRLPRLSRTASGLVTKSHSSIRRPVPIPVPMGLLELLRRTSARHSVTLETLPILRTATMASRDIVALATMSLTRTRNPSSSTVITLQSSLTISFQGFLEILSVLKSGGLSTLLISG